MNTQKINKNSTKYFRESLLKGTKRAIKNLIEERKKTNDYLIVSKNGKVVKIRARDLK